MGHAIRERAALAETRRQGGANYSEEKPVVQHATHAGNTPSPGQPCRYIGTMTPVTITPRPNGPLIIDGPVRIVTPEGRELTPPPRNDGKSSEVVVLCRCGGSAIKPFCDGTHKRNGFQDGPVTTA